MTLAACLAVIVSAGAARAQSTQTLSGVFTVTYGDSGPLLNGPHQTRLRLFDDQGRDTALDMDEGLAAPYGGVQALVGRWVDVTVRPAAPGGSTQAAAPAGAASEVTVTGIQPAAPPNGAALPAAEPVTGTVRWANILCKFKDEAGFEPHPKSFFDDLFSDPSHGITEYWSKQSYGQVDIMADTFPSGGGWYTLPRNRSAYFSGQWANLDLLARDCTNVADADVDFQSYSGVNLMFNDDLDCCAWGGQEFITADGAGTRRMTWQPPWGYENPAPISHEIGHGLGLRHSNNSDRDTNPYDNAWDLMSDLWANCPAYNPPGNTTGCLQRGTIAYHLDYLGWIAPGEKFIIPPGSLSTITIDALDQQTIPPGDYRMAEYNVSSNLFYTIEARKREGVFDIRLPGDGIIIHQVEPGRLEPAWVIGPWSNSITTTGAIVSPGKMVTLSGKLFVHVNSATATGYTVTIGPAVTPPAPSLSGPKGLGSLSIPTFRWSKVGAATGYRLLVKRGSAVVFDHTYDASAVCATACAVNGGSLPPAPTLADGKYTFSVTSMNSYFGGKTSRRFSFTVDTTPPNPPAPILPKSGTTVRKALTLKLHGATGSRRYQIALSHNSDCSSPFLTTPEIGATYRPTGLAYGTYYWCGRARDLANNWSAFGPAASFTLAPPIPGRPVLSAPAGKARAATGSPTFTWKAASSGVTYQLDIATSPSFAALVDSTTQANTSRKPGVVLAVGAYYWRVRAFNALSEPGPWATARLLTVTASPSPAGYFMGFPLAVWLTVPGGTGQWGQ